MDIQKIADVFGEEVAAKLSAYSLEVPHQELDHSLFRSLKNGLLFSRTTLADNRYDHLFRQLNQAIDRVPQKNRIAVSPITGTLIIERLSKFDHPDYRMDLYGRFLSAAIDKALQDRADHAFLTIIDSLSFDEVCILAELARHDMASDNRKVSRMRNSQSSIEHLKALGLVIGPAPTTLSETTFSLTDLGRQFVDACIPEEGFVVS